MTPKQLAAEILEKAEALEKIGKLHCAYCDKSYEAREVLAKWNGEV